MHVHTIYLIHPYTYTRRTNVSEADHICMDVSCIQRYEEIRDSYGLPWSKANIISSKCIVFHENRHLSPCKARCPPQSKTTYVCMRSNVRWRWRRRERGLYYLMAQSCWLTDLNPASTDWQLSIPFPSHSIPFQSYPLLLSSSSHFLFRVSHLELTPTSLGSSYKNVEGHSPSHRVRFSLDTCLFLSLSPSSLSNCTVINSYVNICSGWSTSSKSWKRKRVIIEDRKHKT